MASGRAAAGAGLVWALLAACATPPAPDPPTVPLPPPVAETPAAPATDPAGSTPAAPAEELPAVPTGRFLPKDGATTHFAGASGLLGGAPRFVRVTESAQALAAGLSLERVLSEGRRIDALTVAARERLVAERRADGIWVGLAPERARDVPPAVKELPLPPVPGHQWLATAGPVETRCEVTGVATAETFVGPLEGCALVTLRDADGALVTQRWHHPQRGVVRTEVRDETGRLIYGLALCGADPPNEKAVLAAFPVSASGTQAR